MDTLEQSLDKYAELAVKKGVNVQKGQTLVITAPISAIRFVRTVAEKAYQAGAKHVYFEWSDDTLTLTEFEYAPDEALEEYPDWKAKGFEELAKGGAAFLDIRTPDLDLLNGIDSEKIAAANKAKAQALEPYKDFRMNNHVSWSIIAVPTEEWAEKVFPDLKGEEAVAKLWDTIFQMTRVDQKDPIQAWDEHRDKLNEKAAYLNKKKYRKLHYQAPGTDLTIEFPKGYEWVSAGSENDEGAAFIPNIPTEEVFTLPLKTGVNGTVSSTKPLNYSGNVIDNLSLTFADGKIIDYQAEKGYDTLKQIIETDEGSHYLGEVALVPNTSPISQSGLIFFNTLFDENASCHLAIGKAYPCFEDVDELSQEDIEQRGSNKSLVHVDFMIGSEELDIDGETEDGKTEPVFKGGNWAL